GLLKTPPMKFRYWPCTSFTINGSISTASIDSERNESAFKTSSPPPGPMMQAEDRWEITNGTTRQLKRGCSAATFPLNGVINETFEPPSSSIILLTLDVG